MNKEMDEGYARRQRVMDEARTMALDSLPPLWWGVYQRCRSEGFTEQQSMEILKTYILSLCPYGINGAT